MEEVHLDDENRAKLASEHEQITKIWLSDRCGDETIPMVMGTARVGVDLKVIWEISIEEGRRRL